MATKILYIEEKDKRGPVDANVEDELNPYYRLANAIVIQTIKDYRSAMKRHYEIGKYNKKKSFRSNSMSDELLERMIREYKEDRELIIECHDYMMSDKFFLVRYLKNKGIENGKIKKEIKKLINSLRGTQLFKNYVNHDFIIRNATKNDMIVIKQYMYRFQSIMKKRAIFRQNGISFEYVNNEIDLIDCKDFFNSSWCGLLTDVDMEELIKQTDKDIETRRRMKACLRVRA